MVIHINQNWVGGFKAVENQSERRLRRADNKLITWTMLFHSGYGWAWTITQLRDPSVVSSLT